MKLSVVIPCYNESATISQTSMRGLRLRAEKRPILAKRCSLVVVMGDTLLDTPRGINKPTFAAGWSRRF